jgi:hypothetical protein
MVTKKMSTSEKEKRGRVQLGKLSLSREAIKDLSPKEKSRIKGAAANVETLWVLGCRR